MPVHRDKPKPYAKRRSANTVARSADLGRVTVTRQAKAPTHGERVRETKRDTLNFRIKREDRALIDRAATLAGKSRTDFLLEAGRRAAADTLLDRAFFQADAETFAAFAERLDAPPRPNDRLKHTLQTPAPWDK